MFTNLTISKRLTLGFGSLVVLAVALGVVAIVQMRGVATRATKLSDEYVPEASLAADIKEAVSRLSLAGRSFALSGNPKYENEAKEHAKSVDLALEKASEMATAHPDLVKLAGDIGKAHQSETEYLTLFDETVKADQQREDAVAKLNQAAGEALKALAVVMDSQREKLDGEIRDGAAKEQLLRRAELSNAVDSLSDEFGQIRVAALKLQATRNVEFQNDVNARFASTYKAIDIVQSQFKDPKDVAQMNAFATALKVYDEANDAVGAAFGTLAELTPRRSAASDALLNVTEEISEAALANATSMASQSSLALEFAQKVLFVGLAACVVIGVVMAFFTSRSINVALKKISEILSTNSTQVASASTQVSASSQSLAQGASEQAASLEESSSAIEEMASMIKKNADTSQQANALSSEAKRAADAGSDAMSKMSGAIADIERSSQETAKIIKTIDEIAFQTNLLALNAAVEAARAGEAGKGFAVVAEEVRNLAMRSAEAAKNTSTLIEESVGKAKNGVSIASTVATSLNQINAAATKVGGLISEIAAASREQSTGIDQISGAVGQMDKVTQTNAANAEETAAASEELNAQAEQLQACVSDLQKLVGLNGLNLDSAHARRLTQTRVGTQSRPQPSRQSQKQAANVAVGAPAKPSGRDLIPLESAQPRDGDFAEFTKAANPKAAGISSRSACVHAGLFHFKSSGRFPLETRAPGRPIVQDFFPLIRQGFLLTCHTAHPRGNQCGPGIITNAWRGLPRRSRLRTRRALQGEAFRAAGRGLSCRF